MNCPHCKGSVTGKQKVDLQHDTMLGVVILKVQVWICDVCGEAFYTDTK